MDSEMREAIAKLDLKLDRLMERFADHNESCVRERQQTLDSVRSAHKRIDAQEEKYRERRGWVASLWIGVIVALASSIWNLFVGRK